MKKYLLLLLAFVSVFIFPCVGSYLKWGGMPPGYGLFPAQQQTVIPLPPFNQTIFNLGCVLFLALFAPLLFPRLFGFKRPDLRNEPPIIMVPFPKWFMPALITMFISWFFMWSRIRPIDDYMFVPLWWSFILVLDGLVYKRNQGRSLIATRPTTMKLLAAASSFSWFVFEYQNFFVLENWYYPNNQTFTNFGNITWQLLSYTTVLPAIFEWYFLLRTFPKINKQYSEGKIISISPIGLSILWVVAVILLFLMGYFPHALFWMLWVSLIPALVPVMTLNGYWTPFTPIQQKGDWSNICLIAIATLLNGIFWEFWNFGSYWFQDKATTNPNFWKYAVPYVDKYYLFSEMPILGYAGYLLFGIVCWILWLAVAYLLKFDYRIDINDSNE
jgi:hypothetical protein